MPSEYRLFCKRLLSQVPEYALLYQAASDSANMTKYSWAENYRATQMTERLFLTGSQPPYRYVVAEDAAGKQLAYGIRSYIPLGGDAWRKVYEELVDPEGAIRAQVLADSEARGKTSSPAATQGYDLQEGPLTIWFGGLVLAERLARDDIPRKPFSTQ